MTTSKLVYRSINDVQADLAKEGISKDRKNDQQGYKFRGIDDVYNALSPLLAKHRLCILPRVLKRECVERTNAKGTALFYVTVEVEFDFVSSEDGSMHTIKTFGEAMDSADKATNKAMSAAFKYAAFQAFAIPTEADNDADKTTHEVVNSEYEALFMQYEDEATKGMAALKSFHSMVKSGHKANLWKVHGEHFKKVANDADINMKTAA